MKNKYIIIAIIAIVVIVAIVITVFVTKSKNNDENNNDVSFILENEGDTSPVSMSDDVEISFEAMNEDLASEFEAHDIETTVTAAFKAETTTINGSSANENKTDKVSAQEYIEQTTVKTQQSAQKSDTVLGTIDSFFNGKYYFDGNMIQDGSSSPFEIAMDGENFIVYSEMEEMDIGILCLDGKLYLLNPAEKKYIHLSESLQKTIGIDLDSLKFEFTQAKFDGYSPSSVVEGLYNSEPAVCYIYEEGENHLEFVTVDDEVKQISQFDQSGNAKSVLRADEFTADFSDDEISLNGYKKTNMISFMKDLI